MSSPVHAGDVRISGRRDLVAFLEEGCKPPDQWRIGTEHEKFAYRLDDLRALPYEGPRGIKAVLEGLCRFGWEPVLEQDRLIALSAPGHGSISLEPGGQLELSGPPLDSIHDTCREVGEHLRQVKIVAGELDVGFMGMGFNPKWSEADTPWMPKGRYRIMRAYMPTKGQLGLEMMQRSCTVQVNLDFSSEADMVKKFRVSVALQPVVTALFANSPFREGKPNGFLSYRSHTYLDTDPDRCGMLPFVFEDGFGFERWVDYLLDVPMYFVYRDGTYIDASGQSFRDFLAGRLPALPGELPTMSDWADHMTVVFPEVRLKRYLEMRGADAGPWARLCALPALWVGLLYDGGALDAAWDLIKDWSAEERVALRREVSRSALNTVFRGRKLQELAVRLLDLAEAGLKARGRIGAKGQDESAFLAPLREIARSGRSPAEDLLAAYTTRWNESVDPIFKECAY